MISPEFVHDEYRIYIKGKIRQVLPFHSGEILHPKIVKEMMGNLLKWSEKNLNLNEVKFFFHHPLHRHA